MIQPEVYAPDGSKRLLDDIVPMEWLYITAGLEEQAWMEGVEDVWQAISGRRLVILPSDGAAPSPIPSSGRSGAKNNIPFGGSGTASGTICNETSCAPIGLRGEVQVFRETDGRFARWCNRTGLSAVLIRPDRYVYAGIRDRAELASSAERQLSGEYPICTNRRFDIPNRTVSIM